MKLGSGSVIWSMGLSRQECISFYTTGRNIRGELSSSIHVFREFKSDMVSSSDQMIVWVYMWSVRRRRRRRPDLTETGIGWQILVWITPKSNSTEVRPVVIDLIHSEGQTDERVGGTILISAPHGFERSCNITDLFLVFYRGPNRERAEKCNLLQSYKYVQRP
jgi:hypothetical protein